MYIRSLIIVIIALYCNNTFSQTYYSIPISNTSWKTERCFSFYASGYYDVYTIYTNGQDTNMNTVMYKKMFKTTRHLPGTIYDTTYTNFIGGIRENNKKVYMLCPDLTSPDTTERMIYDFNPVIVGDTIYSERISYSTSVSIPHLVTSIDSVLVGNLYHRRIFLTNLIANYAQEYWIEGIGSNFGLIYASYNCITDNSYDLICFNVNDSLQFQNSSPSFGYCTSPFPPLECDGSPSSLFFKTYRYLSYFAFISS